MFTSKKTRYNQPGHAHELTYSCYRKKRYFKDNELCRIFLETLEKARKKHRFYLWAYVLMPTHVHLLIWPRNTFYDIARIQKDINGPAARHYSVLLQKSNPDKWRKFLVSYRGKDTFRLFLQGGGFDRNVWKPNAVQNMIAYIENNPIKAGLVKKARDWPWSSAYARATGAGLMPDSVLPFGSSFPR